jgi:hypothetical protein
VPKTYALAIDRVCCPKCDALKPRVTLLTSVVVFLRCAKCDHAWELRRSEYSTVNQAVAATEGDHSGPRR